MKNYGKKITLTAIMFLMLTACSHIQFKNGTGMKVEEKTLENGLKVIIKESHSAPVIAFNMWVKTGSRNEEEETLGLSHMLEHMLFKGTEKRKVGAIAQEIDSAGGTINAFTSKDVTVYYLTIASRFFDTGLDIISDTIMNSTLDPDELEKEKKVILEEIRMGDDDPERSSYEDLFMTCYTEHPYKNPVIGYKETVEPVSRDTLMEYYKKWYVPENMTLIIVGDFKSSEALEKIENAFKSFKGKQLHVAKNFREPEQKEIRFKLLKKDVKQAHVKIGFHIPEITSPDVPGLDLMASILGDGDSSRLYRKLKLEKQLVNTVYAYSMTPQDPGLFLVSMSVEPEKIEDALKTVFEEFHDILQKDVTAEEMKRAKLSIESSTIYTLETVSGMAQNLGNYITLTGDVNFEEKYLEDVKNASQKVIKEVAQKYLTKNNMNIVLLLPSDSKIEIDKEKISSLFDNAQQKHSENAPPVFPSEIEESNVNGRRVVKKVFPEGTTLIIEEDHEIPIVAVQASVPGGTSVEGRGDEGAMNFTFEMLPMGAGGKSAIHIAENVDNIGGSLSDFSGRDLSGILINFISSYFNSGIDLFFDILQHPDFPADAVEKKRTEILSQIKNKEDSLTRYIFTLFSSTLFEDHPYGHDILGTKESVTNFSREDLKKYYETNVRPANLTISVVGNVKSEDMIKVVEQKLKGWNNNNTGIIREQAAIPVINKIKENIVNKNREQTHIILGFHGPSMLDKDAYAMEVLDSILAGQGGRLFIELRDKQSLAYSVTSFFRPYRYSGLFGVYIATKPENSKKAVDGILGELKKVLAGSITDEEIERTKKALIGNFEIGLQKRKSRASIIGSDESLGLGYDNYRHYPEKVIAVTKKDILDAAKKYIDPDRYVITIVEPDEPENKGTEVQ